MRILILIEPKEGGGFLASAGAPFHLSAEAGSAEAAACQLETMLHTRLRQGSRLAVIELDNGSTQPLKPPLRFEPLPDDDWFFETMREAIEENRQREQAAEK